MRIFQDRENFLFFSFTTLIIIVAAYFRVVGLGNWGFSSSDEYYIAKTGQNLLKFGLPKFETGGYYTRGILYEYISVFFINLGLKDVFSYRLVSTIFSLISVPAIFLLVKKISNKYLALFTIILFLFSTLQIEFSRLARFYTTFQSVFVWYVFFLYQIVIEKKYSYQKWLFIISIVSLFVYEGGIFIIVLNFLTLIYLEDNKKLSNFIIPSIILIFAFFYLKTDFRNIGVTDFLPPDIEFSNLASAKSLIHLPKVLLLTIDFNNFWNYLVFLPIGFSIYVFSLFKGINLFQRIIFAIFILLSLFNQFGLLFFAITLYALTPLFDRQNVGKKESIIFSLVILTNFSFWLLFSYFDNNWFIFFDELDSFSIKKVIWMFFNYPDIYQSLLIPWLKPMKIGTLLTLGSFFSLLLFVLISNRNYKLKFIFVVTLVMVLGVSIVRTPYNYARYSFFIFPLFVSTIPLTSYFILSKFKIQSKFLHFFPIVFLITFMFFSEDYNLKHLINIDTKEAHFKVGFNKFQSGMYYYREDYKTVGEVVNKNISNDDVVLSLLAPAEYYLNRLDYCYRNYKDSEFYGRAREKGKKEIWTNSKLLYKEKDLKNFLIQRKKNIWLIVYSPKRHYVDNLSLELNDKYKNYLFYENLNQSVNVYKLPKK